MNESRMKNLEEFKIAASKGDVVLMDWAKKFGYSTSSGLSGLLKRHNIKYHTQTTPRYFSEKEEQEICELYKNGKTLLEIIEIYKTKGIRKYTKILSDNNIPIRKHLEYSNSTRIRGIRKFGNEKITKSFKIAVETLKKHNFNFNVIDVPNRASRIELMCIQCGAITIYDPWAIMERFKNERFTECVCYSCMRKTTQFDSMAKVLIKKSNKTGYVGVCVKNEKYKEGFYTYLNYHKVRLINKTFRDDNLSDKTLIEAAVYREKYIIENDLPHTRNFSDGELISNMEMLGQYGDIDLIKNRLGI